MDLQTNGGKPVTSENVPSIDNLRAHSPQIPDDNRLQPDTSAIDDPQAPRARQLARRCSSMSESCATSTILMGALVQFVVAVFAHVVRSRWKMYVCTLVRKPAGGSSPHSVSEVPPS